MINLDAIYHEDCLLTMSRLPDATIDLVVTSPPYDNLRQYKGFSFAFEEVAKELYRIMKKGGVVIWVVSDATVNGSETGTSFRQALYFMDCGFNLHDTMLYVKKNYIPLTHRRYEQTFEYMFCFSKGAPATFKPIMVNCVNAGKKESYGSFRRSLLDDKQAMRSPEGITYKTTKDKKQHGNMFEYEVGIDRTGHPAAFPFKLARDQIITWSNEGDIVYDPFLGSGTTAVAAVQQKRHFLGSEIAEEYFLMANERINNEKIKLTFDF